MVRRTFPSTLLALAVLVAAVSSIGCSMCASPYDYTGPTASGSVVGDGCSQCAMTTTTGRAGSILLAHEPIAYESEMEPGMLLPMAEGEVVGPIFLYEEPVEPTTTLGPSSASVVPMHRVR